MPTQLSSLNSFTRAYIGQSLWSSVDDDGDAMDENYSESDIAPDTLEKMIADCSRFQAEQSDLLSLAGLEDSRAGFCFWLTRNGHGSGFWDELSYSEHCPDYERLQVIAIGSRDFSARDALKQTCQCPAHACDRLSDASNAFGSFDLYVADDGKIHGSPL